MYERDERPSADMTRSAQNWTRGTRSVTPRTQFGSYRSQVMPTHRAGTVHDDHVKEIWREAEVAGR